jgi:hypothetical protein
MAGMGLAVNLSTDTSPAHGECTPPGGHAVRRDLPGGDRGQVGQHVPPPRELGWQGRDQPAVGHGDEVAERAHQERDLDRWDGRDRVVGQPAAFATCCSPPPLRCPPGLRSGDPAGPGPLKQPSRVQVLLSMKRYPPPGRACFRSQPEHPTSPDPTHLVAERTWGLTTSGNSTVAKCRVEGQGRWPTTPPRPAAAETPPRSGRCGSPT